MLDMAKKKKSGKHTSPRKPVQFPADWLEVARRRAVAERPVPLMWYLIELVKKDAEAAGEKNLPPVPWALPKEDD